jgi:autotransporter passenger strand-loop-strand repeat protein
VARGTVIDSGGLAAVEAGGTATRLGSQVNGAIRADFALTAGE